MSLSARPVVIIAAVLLLTLGAGALSWFYLGGNGPVPTHVPAPSPVVAKKPVARPAFQEAKSGAEEPALPANGQSAVANLGKSAKDGKLTPDQLQTYLLENRRNAESLLVASRIGGDLNLLREAAKQFPNDPRVQFDMATRGETSAERRQAIEALRQTAPDNAMGDYFSALDNFKNKNPTAALEDLKLAAGKTRMDDYSVENMQGTEEAYLSAGYSPGDAKSAAMTGLLMPQLTQMNQLGTQLGDLQQAYIKSNDAASAEAVSRSAMAAGQQVQNQLGHQFLLGDLVGIGMEARVLSGVAPNSVLDASGTTAQQRMDELNRQRAEIKSLADPSLINTLQTLPDVQKSIYIDHVKLYGEAEALRWLKAKSGR